MKSQQSGFAHAALITGLVVALIGVLGFVFWQNFIYKEPAETKTEKVAAPPSTIVDPYKSWKTYTSSRDGYSIKYPADWLVINETEGDGPYIRNVDPSSKPDAPKQENTNYPVGYTNIRILVDEDDSNYRAVYQMSPMEFYQKLGQDEVGDAAVTYAPEDVKSLKVGGYDAKSAKSVFTETNEVIFILDNEKLYSIYLLPYGASSDATVEKILDSFSV